MSTNEIDELISQALRKAMECYTKGQLDYAEELYRQVLRIDKNNLTALECGGLVLSQNNKNEEAKQWLGRGLSRNCSNYIIHNNLGLVHSSMNEREEAIRCFTTAINIKPSETFLYTNLALELKKKGDIDEAYKVLNQAMSDNPSNEHVVFNYAALVHENGDLDLAIHLYKKALAINKDFAACHYNLSACYFLMGDYLRAWPEYEWRWKQFPNFEKIRNRFKWPYWTGQNLKGKRILLYMEQGSGDAIMTCRYVKELQSMGAEVVIEMPSPLIPLMKCLRVEVHETYMGNADYHCSMLSVPGVLGVSYDSIIGTFGLFDKALYPPTSDWDKYKGMRVGICWAGSPQHPNDRNRSVMLRHFKHLPVTLFGLQKDARPHAYTDGVVMDYTEGAEGIKFIDLSEHMGDFQKTLNLINRMDVIVTVDTALAHLAGSIYKPTFLLLPHLPDWRWGLDGDRTKWYGSMKLYRNKHGWEKVFDRVEKDL